MSILKRLMLVIGAMLIGTLSSPAQIASVTNVGAVARVVGENAGVANLANDETGNGLHWDNIHAFNQNYPDVGGSAWHGFESFGHDFVGFPQIDNALEDRKRIFRVIRPVRGGPSIANSGNVPAEAAYGFAA